ncbi:LLM class flavin-dependent oxidoreductase [Smaragdicoccus niigatensis]|uniref:LLM class flavin-dependent oxidoreductase n=1 Tax=Smaragdicoccus niigatensis TaxID=359359 RepID=UPI000364C2BA|nr:LLM class flavin-dependent oxidoreductase [Smaragdicoccus niigatensis]
MQIGIGIPNTVPGATGSGLLEWARRADAAGFYGLSSIGAVSYPGYEELTVFAAAGAVTERIRFFSNVLITPARSAAELAKQAATVDQLTNGRLTLGLGAGWREGDFLLTGRDFAKRGAAFDEVLSGLDRSWKGEALHEGARPASPPTVSSGVPIMIGGTTKAAIKRVVDHGIGWTAGGMPPDAVAEFAGKVRDAWTAAGREGSPRIAALMYFGLGDTEQQSHANIVDYYKPMGDEVANMIAGSAARSADAIRGAIAGFEAAGVDEFYLNPTVADPDQVNLLAEAVFG